MEKQTELKPLDGVFIGQSYKHYKGTVYTVLGICQHSETNERLVAYRGIGESTVWVRPIDMFCEYLSAHNCHRFTPID
jgi:hypothetical protein